MQNEDKTHDKYQVILNAPKDIKEARTCLFQIICLYQIIPSKHQTTPPESTGSLHVNYKRKTSYKILENANKII